MGDGECQEGQVWEAAMAAAHWKADHLHAIVDHNKYQQTGPDRARDVVCALCARSGAAFGWHVDECDGHDLAALVAGMKAMRQVEGQPSVLIAHTVKGKGVSFIEKDYTMHGRTLSAQDRAGPGGNRGGNPMPVATRIGERAGLKPGEQLRKAAGAAMLAVARENDKVVVLDGDLGSSTGAHDVKAVFPERHFNVGIAEANMVGIAAGLASCGYIPICHQPGLLPLQQRARPDPSPGQPGCAEREVPRQPLGHHARPRRARRP